MAIASVALDHRVIVATSGSDWHPVTAITAQQVTCLDVSSDRPERLFVGTVDQGLQRSTDGGETVDRVGKGTIDDRVTAVAVSPHDPDVVWAGTEPSRVYQSTDGGVSWAVRPGLTDLPSASRWSFPPHPDTHHVRWIEPDPHRRGRLYVAIEAGAFVRTEDAGETWHDHPAGARRDTHTIETHPVIPDRVYVAAGEGYAESADGGDTWTYPQDGLEHRYVWSVAVDPSTPERQIVSAALGPWRAHHPATADSYVYRRDNAEEWMMDMRGLPAGHSRAVLDAAREYFYAVSDRGLYRRRVSATNWTTLWEWPAEWSSPVARGLAVLDREDL